MRPDTPTLVALFILSFVAGGGLSQAWVATLTARRLTRRVEALEHSAGSQNTATTGTWAPVIPIRIHPWDAS